MANKLQIGDIAVIKADSDYINPEFHGQTGKVLALFPGEYGGELAVFKFEEPYTHPVFTNRIATITISPDLLSRY